MEQAKGAGWLFACFFVVQIRAAIDIGGGPV